MDTTSTDPTLRFDPIERPRPVSFGPIVSTAHTIYSTRWGLLAGAMTIIILIQWPIGIAAGMIDLGLFGPNAIISPISTIVNILVGAPLSVGGTYIALRVYRGERATLSDVFVGFTRWVPVVAVGLIIQVAAIAPSAAFGVAMTSATGTPSPAFIGIAVVLGLVTLVVLLWLGARVYFATLICVDPMGPRPPIIECITTSWRITRGHTIQLLLVALLMSVIAAITMTCLIIPFLLYGGPIFAASAAAAYAFACHKAGIIPLEPYGDTCPHCDYDLSATQGQTCPECGREVLRADQQQPSAFEPAEDEPGIS